MMDLVFIYEFRELRFIGYIENIRYVGKITGGKPTRKILVTGGNMGKLLSSFKLIMNKFICMFNAPAIVASNLLKGTLALQVDKGSKISSILIKVYEDFINYTLQMGEGNNLGKGIYQILNRYIDYKSRLSDDVLWYPINIAPYNMGENNIWDMWRNLMVAPINEMFGRTNKRGVFELIFRQAPFEPDDWDSKPLNILPSIIVTDHDLGRSIEQIYTYYLSLLQGGPYPSQTIMLLDHEQDFDIVEIDKEKWKLYGYKPMIVTHKYYDRNKLDTYNDDVRLMRNLTLMLKRWYEHNDEFLSGTVNIMTVNPNEWKGKLQNPRIGERIGLIDGEFYVESSVHSWNFKGPMTTRLEISRGYCYVRGVMMMPIEEFGNKLVLFTSRPKDANYIPGEEAEEIER